MHPVLRSHLHIQLEQEVFGTSASVVCFHAESNKDIPLEKLKNVDAVLAWHHLQLDDRCVACLYVCVHVYYVVQACTYCECLRIVRSASTQCHIFSPPSPLSPLPFSILQHMPKVKVIVRIGMGFDNVDFKSAGQRGVIVSNVCAAFHFCIRS